jgi:hypothetical protein
MPDLLATRRRRVNFQPSPLLKSEGFRHFYKINKNKNKQLEDYRHTHLTKFGKTERIVV